MRSSSREPEDGKFRVLCQQLDSEDRETSNRHNNTPHPRALSLQRMPGLDPMYLDPRKPNPFVPAE